MISKKAMELPINIVVMLIIGILLFGMGIALFSQFIGAGEEQVSELESQVENDLGQLQCDGNDWICAPTVDMGLNDDKTSYVYVVNREDSKQEYSISLSSSSMTKDTEGAKQVFEKNDECGSIVVAPYSGEISIESGDTAGFPLQIFSSRVIKESCSFTLLAELNNGEKTPLIISIN